MNPENSWKIIGVTLAALILQYKFVSRNVVSRNVKFYNLVPARAL